MSALRIYGREVLLVAALGLVACDDAAPTPPASASVATTDSSPLDIAIDYRCDGFAFQAHYGENRVILILDGQARELPQVRAASGAKYESGEAMLWSKGSEATLTLGQHRYTNCREQENRPKRPGTSVATPG